MAFAVYPSAVVYKIAGQKLKKNAVQHLLWGDWLKPLGSGGPLWRKPLNTPRCENNSENQSVSFRPFSG